MVSGPYGASRARRALLLLGLIAAILVAAPPAGQAAAPSREGLYRERLPNGMQVVILENHRNPIVSLNVFVKVGSMYEDERTNGISHFFEHLFFRGTTRRTGEEFKREIESLGGQTNAKTTKDLTQFYINLPAQYARQGLDILSDALLHVSLRPADVEQERKIVLDEYRISLESPGSIVQELIYSMVFKDHPYRRPIIGTEKSIKGVTIGDLVDFRRRYYTPGRTTLVIVGDVVPSEVMPTVREYFSGYGGKDTPDSIPQEAAKTEVREHVERRELQNAFVVLGFRAPSVRDRPDIYRVDAMTFLLGQGDGSLLNKRLVEDKKLALAASCDFLTQRDPGLITVMATCQPIHIEKVRQEMLATLRDVRAGKFSQKDFSRARNLLMNTYRFGNETNAGKADGLGFYASIDRVDFALSYLDQVQNVTFQDVVAAADKYLDLKDYSVLVVRPPDRRATADD